MRIIRAVLDSRLWRALGHIGIVGMLLSIGGALAGAGAFGTIYQRLQKPFALPALKIGTGEG